MFPGSALVAAALFGLLSPMLASAQGVASSVVHGDRRSLAPIPDASRAIRGRRSETTEPPALSSRWIGSHPVVPDTERNARLARHKRGKRFADCDAQGIGSDVL